MGSRSEVGGFLHLASCTRIVSTTTCTIQLARETRGESCARQNNFLLQVFATGGASAVVSASPSTGVLQGLRRTLRRPEPNQTGAETWACKRAGGAVLAN
jgi:hypothetical protein